MLPAEEVLENGRRVAEEGARRSSCSGPDSQPEEEVLLQICCRYSNGRWQLQLIGEMTLSSRNPGNQLGRLGRICTQEHGEDRSDPGRAFDLEKSAMVVEDVLDDRQAEPGAPHLAGARRV